MVDVNIKGVLYGIAAALPVMEAQGAGQIINLSSIGGHRVTPTAAVYCATKFAVRTISDGLRLVSFRLFNGIGLFRTTALAGAGLERLRWLAPVRPSAVLQVKAELESKRAARHPGQGLVTVKPTTVDQAGRAVLAFNLLILVAGRSREGSA